MFTGVTRQPLPRFRADIQVVVDISAADHEQAAARLEAVARHIEQRLAKTTFQRLPGKPTVEYANALDPTNL